jgi:hypothetical protein
MWRTDPVARRQPIAGPLPSRVGIAPVLLAAWLALVNVSVTPWAMNPDGLSYLDQAAAWRAGDLGNAVNSYWSPGFPLLLAVWQTITEPLGLPVIPGAHLLAAVVAIGFAVAAMRLWRVVDGGLAEAAVDARGRWLVWGALVVGVAVVVSRVVSPKGLTPDLLLATAVLWLATRALALVAAPTEAASAWLALGAGVGVTYLVKTPGLPIGVMLVALTTCLVPGATLRTIVRRGTLAGAGCAVLALPWAAALSRADGHLTLGSSATLNRSWSWAGDVDDVTHANWRENIQTVPRDAYGTFPLWYAPQRYIGEASSRPSNLSTRLLALMRYNLQLSPGNRWHAVAGIGAMVALLSWLRRRRDHTARQALLLALTAAAVVAMYLPIHVEERFYGSVVLMALLGGTTAAVAASGRLARLGAAAAGVIAAQPLMTVPWWPATGPYPSPYQRAIAALRAAGVSPGTMIAVAGDPFRAHWAHQAGVRIGASLDLRSEARYWEAPAETRTEWHRAARAAGAQAFVVTQGQLDVVVLPMPTNVAP